jgi:hypothetical protein
MPIDFAFTLARCAQETVPPLTASSFVCSSNCVSVEMPSPPGIVVGSVPAMGRGYAPCVDLTGPVCLAVADKPSEARLQLN